jgi:N4-(beta-N-acetylglucosaminyl)-L-asparaginase
VAGGLLTTRTRASSEIGAAPGGGPGGVRAAAAGKVIPVVVSSGNGLRATERAEALLEDGVDPLDAAIAGVSIVEEDPEDMSVGYGGLPNEDGVVELDSCVMHGPSWNAGAVAALRGIKTPSRVAKRVMTHTDHVMLVGEGALRFARAQGFKEEELLTERARKAWLQWKGSLSEKDDWLDPEEAREKLQQRPTGTITCLARDSSGNLSGVTTTSGLAFKIPGRVGDSPIIGAGLYVDNDVGAAGATGRGEAVILSGGSRIVVENMRRGMSPEDSIRDVLQRIALQTTEPRLRDEEGRPRFNVTLYAVRKDGAHASGSLWSGRKYAVHDGSRNRLESCFALFGNL